MKVHLNILLILLSLTATAQTTDVALARVYYAFSHVEDTTQKKIPYQERMLLVLGKNASVFTSYDKIILQNKLSTLIKEQTKASGGMLQNITMQKGIMRKVNFSDIYSFIPQKTQFSVESAMKMYIIEEALTPISWKLTKDTASFSGIHCKKATTYFKGRNWIAWYASSLPFQSGPWKLNGLPGLIIEAYDEHKEIQFKFDGLENINDVGVTRNDIVKISTLSMDFSNEIYLGKEIKLPTDAIKATREDMTRLRKALADNAKVSLDTESTQKVGSTRVSSVASNANSKNNKPVLNNPIELPEKK